MNEFEDFLPEDLDTMLDLPFHLTKGEAVDDLYEILTDFMFLDYKLSRKKDVQSLIEDYRLALESQLVFSNEDRRVLELIFRAVEQSANVLQQDKYQLPGQLLGKLMKIDEPKLKPFLEQVKDWREYAWLKPIKVEMVSPQDSLVRTIAGGNIFHAMAISDDGKFAVTTGYGDGLIKKWDLKTGQLLKELIIKETYSVARRSLENIGNDYGWQEVIDAISEEQIKEKITISVLAISPDGNWLATGSSHTRLDSSKYYSYFDGYGPELIPATIFELWNLEEEDSILCFGVSHKDRINCIALSLNAKYAAIGTARGCLCLIDLEKDFWKTFYNKFHSSFFDVNEEKNIKIKSEGFVPGGNKKVKLSKDWSFQNFVEYGASNSENPSSIFIRTDMIDYEDGDWKGVMVVTISDDASWLVAGNHEFIKIWNLQKGCLHLIIPLPDKISPKYLKFTPQNLIFVSGWEAIYQIPIKNKLKENLFSLIELEKVGQGIEQILSYAKLYPRYSHWKLGQKLPPYVYLYKHHENKILRLHYKHYSGWGAYDWFVKKTYDFVRNIGNNLQKRRKLPLHQLQTKLPSHIKLEDLTPDGQWTISQSNNGGIELWHL